MLDLETHDVDDPKNILDSDVHQEIWQQEFMNIVKNQIKDQYQNFNNLGQNIYQLFENELQDDDKLNIWYDMISWINKHLISIADLDNLDGNVERTLVAGPYIYEFICVDNYASLIPALMEQIGITSIEDLDRLINTKYLENPGSFKTDYLKVIQVTIEQLLKLQRISPIVNKDEKYQKLLAKYYYFQELVDYGDMTMFLENYIRPVICKYNSDFIWKMLG